jgi:hypothetical protein
VDLNFLGLSKQVAGSATNLAFTCRDTPALEMKATCVENIPSVSYGAQKLLHDVNSSAFFAWSSVESMMKVHADS